MAKAKDSVAALMAEDAAKPAPADKVEKVRKAIARVREIELERTSLSERSAALGKEIFEIKTKTLVELFDGAKLEKLGIPAEGNEPAFEMKVAWFYKANIGTVDKPNTEAGVTDWHKSMAYVRKLEPDLIKTTYEIQFGLDEDKKRKVFETFLKKNKLEYSENFGVPWTTLTAWLKEQIVERKKKFTGAQLKMLGATVERVAEVVRQRKTRTEPKTASKGKK